MTVTLDDLGEVKLDVEITRPDGRKLTVPVRAMSDQEMWQIRQSIQWPVAPTDIQRVDGKVQEVKKLDDPAYRRAMEDANRRLQSRIMLRSLRIDIPGETEEDKAKALESKLGLWAVKQLNDHILRLTGIAESEVAERAASFQAG